MEIPKVQFICAVHIKKMDEQNWEVFSGTSSCYLFNTVSGCSIQKSYYSQMCQKAIIEGYNQGEQAIR